MTLNLFLTVLLLRKNSKPKNRWYRFLLNHKNLGFSDDTPCHVVDLTHKCTGWKTFHLVSRYRTIVMMTAVLMIGSGRQEGGRDPHMFYIRARFFRDFRRLCRWGSKWSKTTVWRFCISSFVSGRWKVVCVRVCVSVCGYLACVCMLCRWTCGRTCREWWNRILVPTDSFPTVSFVSLFLEIYIPCLRY